jgi:hypothetical protein
MGPTRIAIKPSFAGHLTGLSVIQLACFPGDSNPGNGRFASFQNRLHRFWGQSSLIFNWYRGSFAWVKRSDAWSWSLASSAEVRNEWSCTSTPSYAFMTWTGTTLALPIPLPCFQQEAAMLAFRTVERPVRVVTTAAYWGGPGFTSRPEDRLAGFSWFFVNQWRQNSVLN